MARVISWGIVVCIVLLASYGISMIRVAIMDKLVDPHTVIWWRLLIGIVLAGGGLWFLGGFIYYRDKKKGLLKKPEWKSPQE